MTVTLNLNAEVEKGLQARARARGLSLDAYLQEIVAGRTGSLEWSQCPAVESVPGKVSGAWVLKGTRMPVSAIFENLEAGASIDNIMEWYDGLDREQVKAVIEFAVRSLDKPPALLLHSRFSRTLKGMEVHFTPEQETQLSQIATHAGTDAERLVKDAALRLLQEEARFRAAVREGIAQADRGEFIEEEEMDARLEQMLRS